MAATRLVVDGTMRRVTAGETTRPSFTNASGVDSAAEFFRFVARRAGLPLDRTAEVLIADYAMVLGAGEGNSDESSKGLEAQELAALTHVEAGGPSLPDDAVDCPVCFSSFADTAARLLPCSHAFCEDCTTRWMESHTTCPMCRLDCRFVNGFAPFKPRRRRRAPAAAPEQGRSVTLPENVTSDAAHAHPDGRTEGSPTDSLGRPRPLLLPYRRCCPSRM